MHIDKDGDTTVCKAVILNNGEYLKFVQYQRRGEERLAIEETEWKVWLALFEHLNDLINELERELGVHVERQ